MRVAILDLDGTLLDTLEDLAASVNHALGVVGIPRRPVEEVRAFVGEGARRLIERAVAPHGHLVEPALAAWWHHYREHCLDRTRPYPGITAVLAGAGRTLAVHTNKPGDLARRILEGVGLLGRFAAVVGGDEAPRKPDPTGALEILSRLGGEPAAAVWIGDSRVDAETARAAGIPFVAVTWGFQTRGELAQAGATVFAESAADLAPFLA
ncbi:MAG TPA: HAD hydrolase-like protein [Anaeromyxobacteraceae bacterium]|nr:HAD hydrolase-like protein [Anaeromyxobacteraceae bacterium]